MHPGICISKFLQPIILVEGFKFEIEIDLAIFIHGEVIGAELLRDGAVVLMRSIGGGSIADDGGAGE